MCLVGLYVMFLLLEDVIVGNYSTDAASQDQEKNIEAAYNVLKKNLALDKENKLILNNPEQDYRKDSNISEQPKKWRLERVTQKQYEIINMLWRKTKIFVNEDYNIYTTTPTTSKPKNTTEILIKNTHSQSQIKFSPIASSSYTTTPSKIEFYYNVYDTSTQENKEECGRCKPAPMKITKQGMSSLLPFLVFRIKSSDLKNRKLNTSSPNSAESVQVPQARVQGTLLQKNTQIKFAQNNLKKEEQNKISSKVMRKIPPLEYLFESGTSKQSYSSVIVNNIIPKTDSDVTEFVIESTTAYDKIKFFEMYDQNTRWSRSTKSTVDDYDVEVRKVRKGNNDKILLEHVDQGSVSDHKQAKHAKKHVVGSPRNNQRACCEKDKVKKKTNNDKTNVIFKSYFNETANGFSASLLKPIFPYENKSASWSEYPFAAVYIYEPLQVHCDAAAISTYWLIASGACLSRVSNKPYGGIRSAFVTYCGDQWWQPEMVAYVKYSIVHPGFNLQDKTKKHLYNIGLIQVVNSMMSACANWAPVSIMSHQFAADSEGTWASAIGWGLDRFDTKYGITDLPTTPLMIYKSILYFDSCPGNIGYSKAKRLDEGGGVSNVYCLSLPPYTGEENDPVHGGLLLVGGKLIALYLQEERRPWGEQSALYTGVWRLIPWVMEVAKEPEEIDTMMFDL